MVEYKEVYNPMNDKKIIIGLLITLIVLSGVIYFTNRYDILKPMSIIVPTW